MQILKKYNINNKPIISEELLCKDILEKKYIIISNKLIINKNKFSILDNSSKYNLLYPRNNNKDLKKNIYLFPKKKYENEFLFTKNIPKNTYKLFLLHFFKYLKNQNIQVIKTRIIGHSRDKNIKYSLLLSIQGLIIIISKKDLMIKPKKIYNFKKWKKFSYFLKLRTISLLYKQIPNSFLKIKVSRKYFLKILRSKKNATI